jgi:hypothetical protein
VIHIENCAKKKFLSDETVPMLVRKEKTVDNEVSRTKKSRRPQILGTVRSLPETRSSIMGRVRAVLDTSMQKRLKLLELACLLVEQTRILMHSRVQR